MKEMELNDKVAARLKRMNEAEAQDIRQLMQQYNAQRQLILETYLEAIGEEVEGWRYLPTKNVLVRENGTKKEA